MGTLARAVASLLSTLLVAGGVLLSPAPACAEVKEVRIAFGYGLVYLPLLVAEAQGYFTAHAKRMDLGDLVISVRRISGPPFTSSEKNASSMRSATSGASTPSAGTASRRAFAART